MLKGMAGECGVVDLDVYLEVVLQVVSAQEAYYRLYIDIILVLGRLHGLGFDEEGAGEPLGAGIVACSGKHLSQMFLLTLHIGVEQAHITLASTPEHVILTTQFDGGVDGVLDLHGSASHYIEVGIGGSTVHIALVAEYVGSTPEQTDVVGGSHLFERIVGNGLHVGLVFVDIVGGVDEVHIVEAEIVDAQLLHDFKACVHLVLGALQSAVGLVPLVGACLSAKLVTACAAQSVPPRHCELQPVLHFLTCNYFVLVVVVKSHRVLAGSALKGDFANLWKILFCHN